VDESWNHCARAVAVRFFLARFGTILSARPFVVQLRFAFRLYASARALESTVSLPGIHIQVALVAPLHLRETINGRTYVIEVRPISPDRWRAQLSAATGTTALMPFYGETPDDAAQRLTGWLTRASRPSSADE